MNEPNLKTPTRATLRLAIVSMLSAAITIGCGGGADLDGGRSNTAAGQSSARPSQAATVWPAAAPALLSTLSASAFANFTDIAAKGRLVFSAFGFDGVRIVDVSNLAAPQLVGAIESPSGGGADHILGLAIQHDTLALSLDPGCCGARLFDPNPVSWALRLYDVSDPASPRFVGAGRSGIQLYLVGEVLYTIERPSSLSLLPIGSPAPRGGHVVAVDIRNPSEPKVVATVEVSAAAGQILVAGSRIVMLRNESAVTASPSGGTWPALVFDVFDITDPAAIVPLASSPPAVPLATGSIQAQIVGPLVYWLNGDSALQVSDMRRQFQTVASIDTGGKALSFAVQGDTLYVAQGVQGVAMFDLRDPLAPRFLYRIETPAPASKVVLFDGFGVVVTDRVSEPVCCGFTTVKTPTALHFFKIP